MAFLIGGANSDSGAYQIDNSGRFGGVETFLTKSQSDSESDTDRRKFTVSGWYKQTLQGSAGGWNGLWSAMVDSNNFTSLKINADKNLIFDLNISGTNKSFTTTRVFRDPAAWYHIVVAYDSTDGTAADRLKIYVNGEQAAGTFSADITQNDPAHWGDDASAARVGAYGNNTGNAYMHNGYMADVCMTVGYALAPTAFGKTDDNGVWIPKKPSVTYSANGFFLEFQQTGTSQNSSGIGADTSGNDNHFAIDSDNTQLDSTTDTPTNNFATMNPLYNWYVDPTLAEGNTKVSHSAAWAGTKGTMAVSKGKWYWEVKLSGSEITHHHHGVQEINVDENAQNPQNITGTTVFFNDDGGEIKVDSTATTSDYGTLDSNDILGIALNMDGGSYGQITFYDNGSAIASDVNLSSSSDYVMPFGAIGNSIAEYNFGNPPFSISSGNSDANGYGNFEYAVPSGYYALCTKNLAEYG